MLHLPSLTRAQAVVFDAYGTIFDVHSAVARYAAAVGPEAARLSEIWRGKQLEYTWVLSLSGSYEPFWTLTERALDYALARCPSVDEGVRPWLLEAYRTLQTFPEVKEVIGALRERGLRTGLLSNGDRAMLTQAVNSAELDELIDPILSVEEAGTFKTDPRTYALVEEALSVQPGEVVFVSSNRWDVAGATAFGFATIWVNRTRLPDEYPNLAPVRVISDLRALVAP